MGVWIEILLSNYNASLKTVTPFVGVWIEITHTHTHVTPFVGVWIEIGHASGRIVRLLVTPFVGVWIEISYGGRKEKTMESLPSWECGLKSGMDRLPGCRPTSLPSWECGLKFWLRKLNKMEAVVTPFVGVWIEIQICISV